MDIAMQIAVNSEGTIRSELIRRALRYYIGKNPDRIDAFTEGLDLTGSQESQTTANASNTVYNSKAVFHR